MNQFKKVVKQCEKPVKSVSLVLSGGGARGAIHLGVLKAFDDHNIKIDGISGTSIGAIIGALYCEGLLKMDKLIKLLSEWIPENDFKALKIPYYSCVSNFDSGNYEILSEGDLYKSIVASASIPVVFEPVTINDNLYIDGGLYNNLPVEPLLKNSKCIIGVHVNNYKSSEKADLISY